VALRLVSENTRPAPTSAAAEPLARVSEAAAAGDVRAIETLLISVGPAMLRAARGVLGAQHPDLEDTLQEAALGLLDALSTFESRCRVEHFAARIAVMKALDARRRSVRTDRRTAELETSLPASDRSPDEEAVESQRRELIETLCDSLPTAQCEALVLHAALGFTVDEVAEACQVPRNTVRSRLRLAKEALRDKLQRSPALRVALEDMP
jgi:RNA polymerase sigma-70 factor (ECF subfamily)